MTFEEVTILFRLVETYHIPYNIARESVLNIEVKTRDEAIKYIVQFYPEVFI